MSLGFKADFATGTRRNAFASAAFLAASIRKLLLGAIEARATVVAGQRKP